MVDGADSGAAERWAREYRELVLDTIRNLDRRIEEVEKKDSEQRGLLWEAVRAIEAEQNQQKGHGKVIGSIYGAIAGAVLSVIVSMIVMWANGEIP